MTSRYRTAAFGLLGASLLLAASCVRTRTVRPAEPARLEPLVGLPAVNAVLADPPVSCVMVFYTPRSSACNSTLGALREVLPSLGPGAVIYTVNIDQDPLISGALGIGTVPVAAFLREGAEVDRWVGYRPAFVMRRPLQRFFGSSTTAR